MLINTISFEITYFRACTTESFLIENTLENQEKVFSHRYTRNIHFTQTFSFQFEKDMNMPVEFIEMNTWVAMVTANPDVFAAVADLETV